MLTLGWMMESRASISTTWTNQTDLDSPVHQNSSLCPDQYTDQSTGRASMLICVLTWCISLHGSVHGSVHGKGQHADMCTDMVHQLSKISTRTVHGKGQHADMCGQHADMSSVDGSVHGSVHGQSTGRASMLICVSTGRASMLICVLTDDHGLTINNNTGLFESGNWNEYNLNPLTRIHWRASLEPAAAVIPAPIAGRRSRNKVSVGEPAEGSLSRVLTCGGEFNSRHIVRRSGPKALDDPKSSTRPQVRRDHPLKEQCRQGKLAKWIRNFGKRIGSEGWARGSQFRTRRLLAGCLSC
ncbi:unnamed protein product [Brassica rapa subsp. narinosa]